MSRDANNTIEAQVHLTDEQFSSLMLGDALVAQTQAHLGDCTLCQAEAAKFSTSIDLFNASSLAWTETKPGRRSITSVLRLRERRALYLPVVLAFAAMLLVLFALPAWNRHRAEESQAAIAQVSSDPSTGNSPEQVAEDNQLLQSVNLVLSGNQGSPLPESRFAAYARPPLRTDSRLQ